MATKNREILIKIWNNKLSVIYFFTTKLKTWLLKQIDKVNIPNIIKNQYIIYFTECLKYNYEIRNRKI